MTPALRSSFSELFGTFCLVFAGTGAIVVNEATGGAISHAGVALTFGLVVLAMIYTIGDVSGAHINPAVTLGFCFAGRLPFSKAPGYIVPQFAGALLASATLKFLFPGNPALGLTQPAGPASQSFVLEFLLTLILMIVILSVSTGAKEKGITAGIVIGSVIALEAMFAGPICGASMNPARSLGPAVASGIYSSLSIYLIAPVLGAVSAHFVCRVLRGRECCCGCLVKSVPEQA